MGGYPFSLVATADDVCRLRYADLSMAEEQTRPVPVDEFTFSAGGDGYFVVGENRSGVRAEQMLADYAPLNKVDSVTAGPYFGRLEKTAGI